MAHFAEINSDNVVTRVIVVHNNELLDGNGVEREHLGVLFCQSLFGGNWVQTSYNGNFRKNFAGSGYTYDNDRDAFIAPQPFASWVLNESTCRWEAPVTMPDDGKLYQWDEASTSWVEVT
jgi:hypothetical protein